jgi:hypothetical protein
MDLAYKDLIYLYTGDDERVIMLVHRLSHGEVQVEGTTQGILPGTCTTNVSLQQKMRRYLESERLTKYCGYIPILKARNADPDIIKPMPVGGTERLLVLGH